MLCSGQYQIKNITTQSTSTSAKYFHNTDIRVCYVEDENSSLRAAEDRRLTSFYTQQSTSWIWALESILFFKMLIVTH